jgi:hypothetical protein
MAGRFSSSGGLAVLAAMRRAQYRLNRLDHHLDQRSPLDHDAQAAVGHAGKSSKSFTVTVRGRLAGNISAAGTTLTSRLSPSPIRQATSSALLWGV